MIRQIVIRRFKRFEEVELTFPDHVVLAGPNNGGKTTVLQAIAAWGLALRRWKDRNDFHRHGGGYAKVPIARQAFSAVPINAFDWIWHGRSYSDPIEISVQTDQWAIAMQLRPDSSEQIYVRPLATVAAETLRDAELATVFVPAMSGLGTDEPVYQRPKVEQLLGQAKPGDVLRNLIVEASESEAAWQALTKSIRRLFDYELLPPDATGAHILAEYCERVGGPRYDISAAGSGFQQVLMLLTFLNIRPGSVLLLDEPDAHLHVILQDAIYSELRAVAALQKSQLIIATHSEVIINSVEPKELYLVLATPRRLADTDERARLVKSLEVLSNEDVMLAIEAPGVLYVEDYTDLETLRAWARVLQHPIERLLSTRLFWKPVVWQPRDGAAGIRSREHYDALKLVREDLPGLELVDGDAHAGLVQGEITGSGLQRLRWHRYEIESYLFHPDALARYVEQVVGRGAASAHVADLRKHLEETQPPAFLRAPLGDHAFLIGTKARTNLLPPALAAAGLPELPYTRYHEIAGIMRPQEIHPEVHEKLDQIMRAFRLA
ncbi:MAG TPA: AAA family ATPase [Terriglobales bacterium]|nr:AAA family ATPase [Terriglobales bacterium]